MEEKLPKRLFKANNEPQISQINNSCRMSLISKIKDVLPSEYNEVKKNPTFTHILRMYKNSLGYSARLIHSIMCKQLITEKIYELWFVFGGRPLRFSLQEFHAVTGLKSIDDGNCDTEKWKDDFGFWSKLLKRKGKISIKKLMDEYITGVNKWSHVDIIRLVYICLIAGFVSEDAWENLRQWGMRHEELKIGPIILNNNLLDRVITPSGWLENKEIDAMMYLFRENTNLRRWNAERVGFMNCIFGMKIKNEFLKFQKNDYNHEWEDFILAYGNGELPSHGKTNKRWATDLDRIYVPLNINQIHWISMCINFSQRTIEVFDCSGNNNKRNVEPFLNVIPRIVKAIHPPAEAKHLHVSPYSIKNVQVKPGLNKSSCCCGVYAIKYIECHVLVLDFSLLDDENIQEARLKIVVDLWNAANDTVLIDRMSKYESTQFDSNVVDID